MSEENVLTIIVACSCGHQIKADAANAGKRGRCPHCGKVFRVPEQDGRALSTEIARPAPRVDRPVPVVKPLVIEPVSKTISPVPRRVAPVELSFESKTARCAVCDGSFPADALAAQDDGRMVCVDCRDKKTSWKWAVGGGALTIVLLAVIAGALFFRAGSLPDSSLAAAHGSEKVKASTKQGGMGIPPNTAASDAAKSDGTQPVAGQENAQGAPPKTSTSDPTKENGSQEAAPAKPETADAETKTGPPEAPLETQATQDEKRASSPTEPSPLPVEKAPDAAAPNEKDPVPATACTAAAEKPANPPADSERTSPAANPMPSADENPSAENPSDGIDPTNSASAETTNEKTDPQNTGTTHAADKAVEPSPPGSVPEVPDAPKSELKEPWQTDLQAFHQELAKSLATVGPPRRNGAASNVEAAAAVLKQFHDHPIHWEATFEAIDKDGRIQSSDLRRDGAGITVEDTKTVTGISVAAADPDLWRMIPPKTVVRFEAKLDICMPALSPSGWVAIVMVKDARLLEPSASTNADEEKSKSTEKSAKTGREPSSPNSEESEGRSAEENKGVKQDTPETKQRRPVLNIDGIWSAQTADDRTFRFEIRDRRMVSLEMPTNDGDDWKLEMLPTKQLGYRFSVSPMISAMTSGGLTVKFEVKKAIRISGFFPAEDTMKGVIVNEFQGWPKLQWTAMKEREPDKPVTRK